MQATSRALDHLLRAVGDPVAELGGIGPDHPEFVEAQVIRAAAGVLAKSADALPAIGQAIAATHGRALSREMQVHFDAAEAWLGGDPVLAAETYASIVLRRPHDLLALRLAHSCYFFLGAHETLCAVVDAAIPAWRPVRPGFGFLLSMAAFAHAENGDAESAEALGRQALALDAACPVGVHAVAHAMAESGRHVQGAQWMREQVAQWAGESRMRTHNAWHLAMFDLEAGNVASALGILDAWLLPASARSALDACDAAALLWYLAAEGVDDAGRWQRISDAFERTSTPGFWPYVDLHSALAHFAATEEQRAQRLAEAIARSAQRDDHAARRARYVTQPGLHALGTWAHGRYGEAARLLARLQPLLRDAGGSHVQLQLFKSVEEDALRKDALRKDALRVAYAASSRAPRTASNRFSDCASPA